MIDTASTIHAGNLAGLSRHAFHFAAVAAERRLSALGWTPDEILSDSLAIGDRVNDATAAAFPAAMNDAREAIDAGMNAIGCQTFRASMALAGIAAADAHHAAAGAELVTA